MCKTNNDISLRFLALTIPCTYSFTVRSLDQILRSPITTYQKKKKEVEKKVEKKKSQFQDGKKEKKK